MSEKRNWKECSDPLESKKIISDFKFAAFTTLNTSSKLVKCGECLILSTVWSFEGV